MKSMSSEDRSLIKELLALENAFQWDEFIEKNRTVWDRWTEAFERATKEIPAPFAMTVCDLLGWD
jgi:hypothetical protein